MSKEIIDIFLYLKKVKTTLRLPFSRTLLYWESFQTLHDNKLAWGLHFHCRFDDFVSGLQVCQKYKLQIVRFRFLFRFLFTVGVW